MLVLMQNDFPVGIYTDKQKAEIAAWEHYNQNYLHSNRPKFSFNYLAFEFEIDSKPASVAGIRV